MDNSSSSSSSKKPIKIDTSVKVNRFYTQRAADKYERRQAFGDKGSRNKFQNMTVDLSWEDGEKYEKFIDYIYKLTANCTFCYKHIPDRRGIKANEHDELMITCPFCDGVTIDGMKESKEWVVWVNSKLQNFAMSLQEDGIPPLVRSTQKLEMTDKDWKKYYG